MENNLKFNSAICTSRVQSERLLSLGLKKETADMAYLWYGRAEDDSPILMDEPSIVYPGIMTTHDLPAWSLHRLIEMVAGGSEEQMIFLPDPYDELIEEIAGAIMVGCFPKEYLV